MENSTNNLPAELLVARRKALEEKAVERRKRRALLKAQQNKTVAAPVVLPRPLSPSPPGLR